MKYYLPFILLLCAQTIHPEGANQNPYNLTITVHNSNSNRVKGSSELVSHSQPPLTVTSLGNPSSQGYSLVQWQLPDRDNIIATIKRTVTSINPITIAAATAAIVYGGFLAKLLFTAYSITQPNKWSTWKEHIPLEVLLEVPQQEVAEELVDAIKAKYLTTQTPDLMTPLVQFNNAIDKELTQLNQFVRLHEWLDYTKLAYIFPRQNSQVALAHTKIRRLLYLKDVLLSWMSNYSAEIVRDHYVPRIQTTIETTEPIVSPLPIEPECVQ